MRKQIITTKTYNFEDIKKFHKEDLITDEDYNYLEKFCSEKLFKLVRFNKSKIYEIHEYLTNEYIDNTTCYLTLK